MKPQVIARMGDKLRAIITHYGVDIQRNELIQRLLELAAAVKKNSPNAIAEGIADVLVVFKQLCIVDEQEYNNILLRGLATGEHTLWLRYNRQREQDRP